MTNSTNSTKRLLDQFKARIADRMKRQAGFFQNYIEKLKKEDEVFMKKDHKIIVREIKSFYAEDLPNMASHCPQNECGFSIYRGVLVQWDEDRDARVLWMLDHTPSHILDEMLVVQEHEGGVMFVWKNSVPDGYQEGGMVDGEGDEWCIMESKVAVSFVVHRYVSPLKCPQCGEESLIADARPQQADPTKANISCLACDWKGSANRV